MPKTRLHQMITGRRPSLDDDNTTPPCLICKASHVGLLTGSYVMMRGNWCFSPDMGCEIFVLDPDIAVEFFSLPNGMKAMVVDVRRKKPVTATCHEECLDMAVSTTQFYALEDPEEAPEGEDDDEG